MLIAKAVNDSGVTLELVPHGEADEIETYGVAKVRPIKASDTLMALSEVPVIPVRIHANKVDVFSMTGKYAAVPRDYVTPLAYWYRIAKDGVEVASAPNLYELVTIAEYKNEYDPDIAEFVEGLEYALGWMEDSETDRVEFGIGDTVAIPDGDNEVVGMIVSASYEDSGYVFGVEVDGNEVTVDHATLLSFNDETGIVWFPGKV